MTLLTSTNRTNLRIGKRPGQQFLAVRVHDIILGSYHERWEEFGGWDSLGTIFYVNPKSPSSVNQQNKIYPHARPLFSYSKNYPLVGEMVLVMHSLAKDIVSSGNVGHKMKYYLPAINVWNHPHHNSLPQNIEVPESMQSVFMKTVRPMFKANLKKVQDDHTSGVPTFKSVREAQKKICFEYN